jgi:hypothetical protein
MRDEIFQFNEDLTGKEENKETPPSTAEKKPYKNQDFISKKEEVIEKKNPGPELINKNYSSYDDLKNPTLSLWQSKNKKLSPR